MKKADSDYRAFLDILKEELIPAGGCTEPIAIAYTAAVACKTLGCRPEHMDVYASGNLIKNAKGVYIPNGGELRGVDAAAILGALGGNADRMLEVLLDLPDGSFATCPSPNPETPSAWNEALTDMEKQLDVMPTASPSPPAITTKDFPYTGYP